MIFYLASTIVILVAAIVLLRGRPPRSFPNGSESAQRLSGATFKPGKLTLALTDLSRKTAANGDQPGADKRVLPVTVWYPANSPNDTQHSLIIYSHGGGSDRSEAKALGCHLAGHGYIVVAPDYPLTCSRAPGGLKADDVPNQPGDASFVIDQVLLMAADPSHALFGKVDNDRIGAMGMSLGGLTTELLAFHPQLGDPRVTAALVIAAPTSMFADRFFSHRAIPFLMLAGSVDLVAPAAIHARRVVSSIPESQLVMIEGGTHLGFLGSGTGRLFSWLRNPDQIAFHMLRRSIKTSEASPWWHLLGDEEIGIIANADLGIDPDVNLPRGMNPLRQLMITQVVTRAFFDGHFSEAADEREQANRYLKEILEKEVAEATHHSSHFLSN